MELCISEYRCACWAENVKGKDICMQMCMVDCICVCVFLCLCVFLFVCV